MANKKCIPDETRAELKKDYLTVQDFLERGKNESNENVLATEIKSSYTWKAAAMEILEEMKHLLLNLTDDEEQQENEAALMLAIIYLHQGTIISAGIDKTSIPHESETHSIETAKERINKCIDILNKQDINTKTVIPMISALHQLGFFFLQQNQVEKAKKYIEQAENVYNSFKSSQHSEPVSMSSIFGFTNRQEPSAKDTLEELHMGTYYYFTQLYGIIGNIDKTVIYCFITIKKQSEINDIDTIDWALGYWRYILSEIFKKKDFSFQNVRRCLAGAACILEKYEGILKELSAKEQINDNEQEILDSKWKYFKQVSAQISRFWAKYGLLLMSTSKERLIKNAESREEPAIYNNDNKQVESEFEINQEHLGNLELDAVKNDIERFVNSITDKYILDFNDAKPVFIKVLKWLDDAKSYYTLENHTLDYGLIIQDMSELYRVLIFYEKDKDRQAKMHKRRIDLLEGIVKELQKIQSPVEYRHIWADLGATYSEMVDIKLDRLRTTNENSTPQMLSKINNLIKSAILNYTKFIDSLKTSNCEKYPENLIRPALCSYYHLGRLHYQFILPNDPTQSDRQKQKENLKKSLDAYKYVINYCKKDPMAAELLSVELSACKEFIELLPRQIKEII